MTRLSTQTASDVELFVADVAYEFEDASEGGDVLVEDVDIGAFTVLDLADLPDGHPHRLSDFALVRPASVAMSTSERDPNPVSGVIACLEQHAPLYFSVANETKYTK